MLNIRPATDSDMETGRFVEIAGRAMGRPEKTAELIAQARARDTSILVACSDREIVGTIISEARDDRSIEIINVAISSQDRVVMSVLPPANSLPGSGGRSEAVDSTSSSLSLS